MSVQTDSPLSAKHYSSSSPCELCACAGLLGMQYAVSARERNGTARTVEVRTCNVSEDYG